jgi:hypothetical protein
MLHLKSGHNRRALNISGLDTEPSFQAEPQSQIYNELKANADISSAIPYFRW